MGPMRKTVKRALGFLGFTDTVEAKNGKDGYDLLIANHGVPGKDIGLGVIDWNMVPTSGLDLLNMVRSDPRLDGFVFIMLTAEQDRDNIVLAIQGGVDDYIIKPFTPETLKTKLENVLKLKLSRVKKEIDAYFRDLESSWSDPGVVEFRNFDSRVEALEGLAPWSHMGPLFRARVNIRFERFNEAEKHLKKVIATNFGIADAHQLLSKVFKEKGKTEESLKELEIAVVERPGHHPFKQQLGESYMLRGRYNDAVRLFSEALALMPAGVSNDETYPDLISTLYNIMTASNKTGRQEEANRALRRVQSLEPKEATGWVNLGRVYLGRHELSKALFAFGKGEEMAKDKYVFLKEIAIALFKARAFDSALESLNKAKNLKPSDPFPCNLSGMIGGRINLDEKAMAEFKEAFRLDPTNGKILFNLAVAYGNTGQKDKGLACFIKARQLAPELTEGDDYINSAEI